MKLKGFVLLIAWMTLSGVTYGQVITGTISGTIKDSSGAVLPGASVQVQNTDTGQGRTVTTDARGYYTAPNIRPGNYEVSASVAGFQTEVRQGLMVNVGQASVIDFTLQVGAVTERVEVTAEAPLVETTNAVVSGLVTERQVEDLPLNSRSLIELAPLQAGIVMAPTGESSASKGMGAKFVVSGTRYNTNLFQVDGADINDLGGAAGSASQNLMGAETIKEFNVVINAYSAEYGKHSGGVFNAVTKSGTNTLHGSAFNFLRNDNLDANRWEDNKNSQEKAEFKRNQFGGSLGGPIVRDRTFFFGSYEGLRERLGDNSTFNVPTAELRRGDILDINGNVVRHRDVVPQVQPFLDFYPLPSPNGLRNVGGTQQRFESFNRPTNEDFFAFRTDHKISDADSIFGRYTYSDADRTDSQNLSAVNTNRSRNQSASIGYTRIMSATVINQFLLSWARNNLTDADAVVHEGLQLPAGYQFTSFPGTIGAFSVQGLTLSGFGNEGARNYMNMTYQVKDDLFYTAGNHTWKFGFNMQRNFLYTLRHFQGQGNYAFQNGGTACGTGTCQGVDNFLRGMARNFTALTRESQDVSYIRNLLTGLYIQDDWRVSPKLTVNLGLRYEFITVPSVQDGRVSTLRDFTKPGQSVDDLVLGNPTFLNPSLKNFAPRIGIAWDPFGNGRTSIRAGTGIFHDQINAGAYAFSFLSSPPYYNVGNITGTVPNVVGQNPVNNPVFPIAYYTQQDLLGGSPNLEGFQYIPEQPTIYKWSFEIQHEFPGNLGVTAGYAASRGVHLFRVVTSMNARFHEIRDGRIFIPTLVGGVANPLISPRLGRIRPRFSDVTSDYHALLLTVKKRLSRGLQFQTSYTLSKTVDDSSNWTGSSDWDNGSAGSRFFSLKDRSLAAFDVRQALVTNGTYQLPGNNLEGVAGRVLGGWQLSSVLSLRGGNPFNPAPGANNPGNFTNMTNYPDRVGPIKYDTRNSDQYFDPSAFAYPLGYAAGEAAALGGVYVGNTGRHVLIGPGQATLDVVLQKGLRVTERVNLNFRTEFFNFLNRVNFGEPDTAIFTSNAIQPNGSRGEVNPDAGRITSTRGNPRQLQFGLRVEF